MIRCYVAIFDSTTICHLGVIRDKSLIYLSRFPAMIVITLARPDEL